MLINVNLKYLFEIFSEKDKFEWITYDEMLKEDGIYFGTCHWDVPTVELKKKYFVKENSILFPTYEIRNGKCTRFYKNEFPTEEQQNNASKIYENTRFIYLLKNELTAELTDKQKGREGVMLTNGKFLIYLLILIELNDKNFYNYGK